MNLSVILNSFVVLLLVADPFGLSPVFASLTRGYSREKAFSVAWHGVVIAASILVLFYLIGNYLLPFFGIGIPAFQIAGGILLLLLSIDMVFARQSGLRSTTPDETREASHRSDISVFPLAFPLLAGPGALTTVLLMATNNVTIGDYLIDLVVILVVMVACLLTLVFSMRLLKVFGETGSNVISRLFGVILAAKACQYGIEGVLSLL